MATQLVDFALLVRIFLSLWWPGLEYVRFMASSQLVMAIPCLARNCDCSYSPEFLSPLKVLPDSSRFWIRNILVAPFFLILIPTRNILIFIGARTCVALVGFWLILALRRQFLFFVITANQTSVWYKISSSHYSFPKSFSRDSQSNQWIRRYTKNCPQCETPWV